MADYNVNMKKFNGTDYDNLLPLAYNALNSQQLDGKTFNEIQNLFNSTDLYLYTSSYIGTGGYGSSGPKTLTFPFEPIILFMPIDPQNNTPSVPIPTSKLSSEGYVSFNFYSRDNVFIKMSSDRKAVMYYGSNYYEQFNMPGGFYYFAAIGGYDRGQITEYLITSSGTWTVPKTGRYYIELYGGGGYGAVADTDLHGLDYIGGSSCQTYEAITLNEGEAISVVIGTYGDPRTGVSSTGTQFGSYSVAAGGNATSTSGGVGSGNKGTTLQGAHTSSDDIKNPNNGRFGEIYGYGSDSSSITGAGAVYLKYLGT